MLAPEELLDDELELLDELDEDDELLDDELEELLLEDELELLEELELDDDEELPDCKTRCAAVSRGSKQVNWLLLMVEIVVRSVMLALVESKA